MDGGGSNVLSVWPYHISDHVPPLYTLTHHQVAVKIITMSSGGGGGSGGRSLVPRWTARVW